MKNKLNWSTLLFMTVSVVCGTVMFSLVLFRDPDLLREIDWVVASTFIVATASGLYQMVRKAGLFKDPPAGGALVLLLASGLALQGCAGLSPEGRARYSLEMARCLANEREIVDRQGTTYEEDRTDLEAERARCNAALSDIEGGE